MTTNVNNIVNSLHDRIVCYNNMVNEMKKDIAKNLRLILDTFEKKEDDFYQDLIVLDFNIEYFKNVNTPSCLDGYWKESIFYDERENCYCLRTADDYGCRDYDIEQHLGYEALVDLFNEISLYLEYKELKMV